MFRKIAAIENDEGIELAQGPSDWFYGIALDWCEGASIEDITAHVEVGEGDIVSVLNKTVDLLDQFHDMLRVYDDTRLLAVVGRRAGCWCGDWWRWSAPESAGLTEADGGAVPPPAVPHSAYPGINTGMRND